MRPSEALNSEVAAPAAALPAEVTGSSGSCRPDEAARFEPVPHSPLRPVSLLAALPLPPLPPPLPLSAPLLLLLRVAVRCAVALELPSVLESSCGSWQYSCKHSSRHAVATHMSSTSADGGN